MKTKIISAFPGCGKTYFYNIQQVFDLKILDSDSSEFSWVKDKNGNNTKERNPNFPSNYMKHIKDNLGKVDIIFISSHDVVRNALKELNIVYYLVYPKKEIKEEWIKRFEKRGDNENFIRFIYNNWDKFIDEIINEDFPIKIELESNQHLLDVF